MWLLYAPAVPPVHLASIHDLPSQASGVMGIWLVREEGRDVASQLVEIRRQSSHAHLPVFVDCELPEAVSDLGDGFAKDLAEAVALAAEWQPTPSRLPITPQSPALALARYLYLRPFAALTPCRDHRAHQSYRYPLAEAFSEGPHSESLVEVLFERGWLGQGHLIDRLRKCAACHSTHLNYIDICPACKSLDIKKTLFIHCFTCSHVAPQDLFFAGGMLVCPNCHARLRHIGVDYNRPLEQLLCRECSSSFAEALVVAKCLVCDRSAAPEDLPVVNVASYTLSEAGRMVAKEGAESRWCVGLSSTRGVSTPEEFGEVMEWMISLARRHNSSWFSLLGIHVDYSAAPNGVVGGPSPEEMLEAFAERIREQMRDTDIMTRLNKNLIWIGLPHTDRAGAGTFLTKIDSLVEESRRGNGTGLEVMGCIYSFEDIPAGSSMTGFLLTLGGKLPRVVSC